MLFYWDMTPLVFITIIHQTLVCFCKLMRTWAHDSEFFSPFLLLSSGRIIDDILTYVDNPSSAGRYRRLLYSNSHTKTMSLGLEVNLISWKASMWENQNDFSLPNFPLSFRIATLSELSELFFDWDTPDMYHYFSFRCIA